MALPAVIPDSQVIDDTQSASSAMPAIIPDSQVIDDSALVKTAKAPDPTPDTLAGRLEQLPKGIATGLYNDFAHPIDTAVGMGKSVAGGVSDLYNALLDKSNSGIAALEDIAKTGGAMGAAFAGGSVGSALGPLGTLGGATLGAALGYFGMGDLAKAAENKNIGQLPDDPNQLGEVGQMAGASAPLALAAPITKAVGSGLLKSGIGITTQDIKAAGAPKINQALDLMNKEGVLDPSNTFKISNEKALTNIRDDVQNMISDRMDTVKGIISDASQQAPQIMQINRTPIDNARNATGVKLTDAAPDYESAIQEQDAIAQKGGMTLDSLQTQKQGLNYQLENYFKNPLSQPNVKPGAILGKLAYRNALQSTIEGVTDSVAKNYPGQVDYDPGDLNKANQEASSLIAMKDGINKDLPAAQAEDLNKTIRQQMSTTGGSGGMLPSIALFLSGHPVAALAELTAAIATNSKPFGRIAGKTLLDASTTMPGSIAPLLAPPNNSTLYQKLMGGNPNVQRSIGSNSPPFQTAPSNSGATLLGLPADKVLAAVQKQESGPYKNPDTVVSPKGAIGAYQIMPAEAKAWGIDPTNRAEAKAAITDQLARLYGRFKSPELALAANNWGEGNLDLFIKKHGTDDFEKLSSLPGFPEETKNYVNGIMGNLG